MSGVTEEKLAILGGPKAVTVEAKDHWPIPTERIKAKVCELIDNGIFWEPGTGISLQLETDFASYIGAQYCLAQNNGTSTLWAAYYAVGLGSGDEVLHPAFSVISSIAPALHLGARPVFCEIDSKTLTIDPADMERGSPLGPKPSASSICTAMFATWTRSWRSPTSTVWP